VLEAIFHQNRLIFGCGNPLFGDDGFGAEVIRFLNLFYTLPKDAAVLDVGTAVRDFLIDILLLEQKPSQIIIVDAMEVPGAAPGEIREISVNEIQPAKIGDFSLHQFPTVNMLKEISTYTAIDVRILVAKPAVIPSRVDPGLSLEVKAAVPEMCDRIMQILEHPAGPNGRPDSGKIYFRVGRLAEMLSVHRNTVTNWIKEGKIPAQPAAGRRYAVEKGELKRFCRQSGVDERLMQELL